MAVVLTYDAPEAAHACIAALDAQTVRPATVLVVDNASVPPFVAPAGSTVDVEVLRIAENGGPAGGYAAGLRAFLASDHAYAWLVDDDATPRPDALAAQLHAARLRPTPTACMATMVDRDTGAVVNTHGWCGVLIPRPIVATVGTPMEELFWWSEDTEYLQWRIPRAGFTLERVDDAVVVVGRRRLAAAKPAWKYYYETRNQVFFRLHVQRQPEAGSRQRHLTIRVRWWRALRVVVKLAVRAVVREPAGRGARLAMVVRGARDGLRGRLGRTVPVDVPDRPLPPGADGSAGRVDPEEALDRDEA
jgi:GT2 family glycosyltransferase